MNTYEENLRDSITLSLAKLSLEEDALKHGHLQAQIAHYHAKGALLAAHDRLELDESRYTARRKAHDVVQRAELQAQNLLATLTQAKQGSDNAIGNVGTAAANLQASADGIMQLASTVGSAMNMASAAMYDTELFHQIGRINDHLNQVANQARYLAVQGMEVASKCAESIAGALADQGKDVQGRLTDLRTKTAEDLDRSVKAVHAVRQQLNDAASDETMAQGGLLDAAARSAAMDGMVLGAVRYANLGLKVEVLSAGSIKVSFLPFKAPFPDNHVRGNGPAPQVETYLAVVPQSRTAQFTNDQAAQFFGNWDGKGPTFVAIQPGEAIVELKSDVYGNRVRAGVACCAFLYMVPSAEFKRHVGNYADHVSIASAPFLPLTPLPHAMHGGPSDKPRRLLLAVAANEQDQDGPSTDGALQLEDGVARLEPHLKWLRRKGAKLDPAFALRMDAVLPPFANALQSAIDALEANDSRAAEAANAEAQAALGQLSDWQSWVPPDTAASAEFAPIPGLIEELAAHIAKACADPGAKQGKNKGDGIELRCILLDHATDPSVGNAAQNGQLPDFFKLSIAEQIAPANYIVAERLAAAPEGAVPPAALEGKPCHWYAADIENDDTDNFGNPLLAGHRYTPFVLATTRGAAPGEWANTLSVIDNVWQFA